MTDLIEVLFHSFHHNYLYKNIVMEPILATVSINLGLEKNNPVLIIKKGDNVSEIVEKMIKDYQLPPKAYKIVMERVQK